MKRKKTGYYFLSSPRNWIPVEVMVMGANLRPKTLCAIHYYSCIMFTLQMCLSLNTLNNFSSLRIQNYMCFNVLQKCKSFKATCDFFVSEHLKGYILLFQYGT